jgi:hypothetical protein
LSANSPNNPSDSLPANIKENKFTRKPYRALLIIAALALLALTIAGSFKGGYSMGRYAGMAEATNQNDELRTAFAKTASELSAARLQIKSLNEEITTKNNLIGDLQSQGFVARQAKCQYLQEQINLGKQEIDQIFKNPSKSVSYGVFTLSPDQKTKVEILNERVNNFIKGMGPCK